MSPEHIYRRVTKRTQIITLQNQTIMPIKLINLRGYRLRILYTKWGTITKTCYCRVSKNKCNDN